MTVAVGAQQAAPLLVRASAAALHSGAREPFHTHNDPVAIERSG
jgi:hypothetical protein